MAGLVDRLLTTVAPNWALSRAQARLALSQIEMRYDAATTSRRASSWTVSALDADAAAAQRKRLAMVSRDMIRNTPFATRAQMVISGAVVGDGIIPKVTGGNDLRREELRLVLEDHLDSVAIDAAGRNNLYGLQRLAMNAITDSGEVIIRRRRRRASDGLPLNFQIEVLEADYLDGSLFGDLRNGNTVRDGIEYDRLGRRVAYYLFKDHPGGNSWGRRLDSVRVPARDVMHVFRTDRPGQNRGVSWFAPVAMRLQDLADYQDAQLMRQKIAACFTAFRTRLDDEPTDGDSSSATRFATLQPGRVEDLAAGEDIKFATPPGVEAYDEFTRGVLREAAAGLGVTYEALTGDLSNVNFTSGRMGRMDMERNVSAWQWTMMIPQMMQPLSGWLLEEFAYGRPALPSDMRIAWVPPARIIVDPAREIPALIRKVRGGFVSRSDAIRSLGYDPERVEQEIARDNSAADKLGLILDSDPRRTSNAGLTQARPGTSGFPEIEGDDE